MISRACRTVFALVAFAAVAACGGGDETGETRTAAESSAAPSAPVTPADTQPQSVDTSKAGAAVDTTGEAGSRGQTAGDTAARDTVPGQATQPAQVDVPRLLRRTSDAYAGMRTLQARFTMSTENPLIRSRVSSRGRLYQRRPDRILLRFEDPEGDLILGDGQYFWIYYPSTDPGQVIRARAAEGAAGGVDLWAQFVGDPVARFEHSFRGTETRGGREVALVTLVPRQDPGYKQLDVAIDTRDFLVRHFEITEHNGTVRRIDLEDLTVNPTLADDLFRFVPPAGVRVVERG
jgi:outer membrane lipoprotein carrier protein